MSVSKPLTVEEFDTVLTAAALVQTRTPHDQMSVVGLGGFAPRLRDMTPEERKHAEPVRRLFFGVEEAELKAHGMENVETTTQDFARTVYVPASFTAEQAAYIAKGFGLLFSRLDNVRQAAGWILYTHRAADKFPGGWTALLADMQIVDRAEHAKHVAAQEDWDDWREEFYSQTAVPEVVKLSAA